MEDHTFQLLLLLSLLRCRERLRNGAPLKERVSRKPTPFARSRMENSFVGAKRRHARKRKNVASVVAIAIVNILDKSDLQDMAIPWWISRANPKVMPLDCLHRSAHSRKKGKLQTNSKLCCTYLYDCIGCTYLYDCIDNCAYSRAPAFVDQSVVSTISPRPRGQVDKRLHSHCSNDCSPSFEKGRKHFK